MVDRQTDGRTTRTITIASAHIVAGQRTMVRPWYVGLQEVSCSQRQWGTSVTHPRCTVFSCLVNSGYAHVDVMSGVLVPTANSRIDDCVSCVHSVTRLVVAVMSSRLARFIACMCAARWSRDRLWVGNSVHS